MELPAHEFPPAKMATFPTEAAAKSVRATLSRAVDHVPDALLYISTASNRTPPAVIFMKQQAAAAQAQATTKNGRKHKSRIHNTPKCNPSTHYAKLKLPHE
jgi:hypothetical protein